MAAVDTRHPDLTADRQADWRLMRDVANGARAVKAAGETYLPFPSGFRSMPDGGVYPTIRSTSCGPSCRRSSRPLSGR